MKSDTLIICFVFDFTREYNFSNWKVALWKKIKNAQKLPPENSENLFFEQKIIFWFSKSPKGAGYRSAAAGEKFLRVSFGIVLFTTGKMFLIVLFIALPAASKHFLRILIIALATAGVSFLRMLFIVAGENILVIFSLFDLPKAKKNFKGYVCCS